ncbi:50S ribosomal protein L30e [Thermogladius sp. KZ2Tp1]|uniref:50S ribosomal protein L30e n=1 Tax=Thermogladius sp. KZ2Tp1 TaxID=3136289 RepID=UPI003DA8BF59
MSAAQPEIIKAIQTAYKTGKVVMGYRRTVKLLLHGKVRLVILAANAPPEFKEDVYYYSKLSNVPVLVFPGTNMELGTILGKPFGVSTLGVIEPGQSNILELAGGGKQ